MSERYFVGGASLSGKAEVVRLFQEQYTPQQTKALQYVATDGLRRILWANLNPDDEPALFQLHKDRQNQPPEEELIASLPGNLDYYIERQERQQRVVWDRAVEPYIESQADRDLDVLAEGVAIMPHHLAELTEPHRAVFVGNCEPSEEHYQNVLAIARNSKDHWMRTWTDRKIRAWVTHVIPAYSQRIERLAEEYGYQFFDLSQGEYQDRQRQAANHLLGMAAVVGSKAA